MAAVAQAPNQLQSEIKSIASKLGFTVPGTSFEYDDFSVDVAKQSVNEAEKDGGRGTGGNTGSKKAGKNKKEGGKKGKGKQQRVGVEPAPESKTFRSLLGPQEPAVWYEAAEQLPKLPEDIGNEDVVDEMMAERKLTAEAQLKREKAAFEKKMKHDYRDAAYLQKVKIEGTSADRIAALTLSIRESSLANVSELEPLLAFMEKRKGSRELVARSMEALGELFRMYLLPDRKLKFFEQQSVHVLTEDSESAKHALYWYVEDLVKRAYARFIAALEVCSCDPLEFLRERSMRLSMNLLAEKPEQEARLLAMLINRLGDQSKRLGSKVVMYLDILLQKHPHWKEVIAREVERCTLLPNTPMRVVHYATATLNQMTFDRKKDADRRVAHRLVDFYFTLFKMILDGHIGFRIDMEKKAEMKAKGNKFHKKKFAKKMSNKNKSKHDKKSAGAPNPNPKIEEMDARILNNLIVGVRRAIVHVPSNQCDKLVQDHMDNLFRVVHVAPIGVGVQALTLLFHILPGRTTSGDRLYRALYARLAAPDLLTSSKLPLMVSTVFKAMKDDVSLARMMAFTKRLLQAGATASPGAAAGFLLLLSELMKVHRGLRSAISQPEEDEGEEAFVDVENNTNGTVVEETSGNTDSHHNSTQSGPAKRYQIGEREPLHCKAETNCLWELCGYLHHVHPTVSGMTRSLLSVRSVDFLGDPLQDLELVPFLDKFQGKEAKSHAEGSVFRPMGGVTGSVTMARVGSKSFGELEEEAVGVEDLFFHKYYRLTSVKDHRKVMSERRKKRRGKKRNRDGDESDDFDQTDHLGDVLTDEEDEAFEDLEDDLDEADLGKLVQSRKDKHKDKLPDEEFNYEDLAAAMESDGLSGSDLEMGGTDADDMSDGAEVPLNEGSDAQSSEELDDIELPAAEFPMDALEMGLSKSSPQNDEKPVLKPKKRRKKRGDLFAPAEDYEHLLNGEANFPSLEQELGLLNPGRQRAI